MLQKIIRFFRLAHPVKKGIVLLWAAFFVAGILFSIFFLTENGIEKTFTTFLGEGITLTNALVFWSLFIVRTLFFVPVSVLMIAAPFIFGGFWEGLLMAGIGEIIGAVVGFLFARYYGQEFVDHFMKNSKTLDVLNEKMEKFGGIAVGLLRVTPVTFDIINFGAGISKMKFSRYWWATVISVWPDCMVYVSLGGAISNPINLLYTISTVIILALVIWYLKQHPEYREMFVLDVQEKTSGVKKQLKQLISPKKIKNRKKRF